jgi:aspartate kinase
MKVFKFGGASLKDAAGIRNVASIIESYSGKNLLVVVSAMGKTTNALEKIVDLSRTGSNFHLEITLLKKYHEDVMRELFRDNHPSFGEVSAVFNTMEKQLEQKGDPDQIYDQIVSLGEVLSSIIAHHYLLHCHLKATWLDARKFICTDKNFREGRVDWHTTAKKISELNKNNLYLTQGFIGSTPEGMTTTLGREGSDFSAAIFASCLAAESVTIWKDVPGVMSADPKRLPNATVFDELPFKEAAEMTYYGASVIHPKTIKPLANKGIPLLVKNFDDPKLPGTRIHECHIDNLPPLIVFKENQCLISCKVTDYTFVNEKQLGFIFNILNELSVHINVMQNSAISFSFCVDFREYKVAALIERLQKHFEVYYNTGLTLITVKNYDQHAFETYRNRPGILMEQSSRSTLQVLVKT